MFFYFCFLVLQIATAFGLQSRVGICLQICYSTVMFWFSVPQVPNDGATNISFDLNTRV